MATAVTEYLLHGIEVDPQKNELRIDLNQPRTIQVRAINELTRVEKLYILKITEKGLCLV